MSDAQRKRLLKIRSRINKRRPKFRQFESWRYVRVKDHWRRPTGIDNKMRFNLKGWPRSVTVGWRGPAEVRGLHSSGMEEVAVWNTADLDKVNPQIQVARIGGTVGARKREAIRTKAAELGVRILNPGLVESKDEFEELEDEGLEEESPEAEGDAEEEDEE
ncbi:50S ribosomal protein L32e [Candidatus Bathyarchaeota archaeon RBG_16_57_9]|nr:MAG: 50S ribosomal protein L32e [Candidatus Bathyarchaeota archaeon RBG_16_57_9]OGD54106.1 MAG: 50S ribosomal protein L32e [Candidatus Bathyarchaeota archaeon RBG_13_60_20]